MSKILQEKSTIRVIVEKIPVLKVTNAICPFNPVFSCRNTLYIYESCEGIKT